MHEDYDASFGLEKIRIFWRKKKKHLILGFRIESPSSAEENQGVGNDDSLEGSDNWNERRIAKGSVRSKNI